ncbi:MAG: type V CRISPR-associated protein Cas12a/Cpf1 [Helicobacteraceae bacterium]|jgi:CRISPR-associated protein Cpf1|nr:type V CRISPR-associated protein Cas12a/Cpf1 [Helicobacteraceae bacterium]
MDSRDFTNLYSLHKTLRFELKPFGGTEKIVRKIFNDELKLADEIKRDKELAETYKKVKTYIDCMHRNIIDDVLGEEAFFDKTELEKLQQKLQKSEEEKETDNKEDIFSKAREKIAKKLRKKVDEQKLFEKELLNSFKGAEESSLARWINTADEKYMRTSNEEKINKEDAIKYARAMKGWFTYFAGFNENRKNIYEADGRAGAIATRIMDDNFKTFAQNIENYEKIRYEHPELEKYINNLLKGENIFELDYFNKCLTQEQIDIYNEKLGSIAKRQGVMQDKGINQTINEYMQKLNQESKNGKINIDIFVKLKKQILGISRTRSFRLELLEKNEDVINAIKKRYENLTTLQNASVDRGGTQHLFDIGRIEENKSLIEKIKSFLAQLDNEKYNFEHIYLNKKSLNNLSKKVFEKSGYIEQALTKYYENSGKGDKILSAKEYSIKEVDNAIKEYLENDKSDENKDIRARFAARKESVIVDYFKNPKIVVEEEYDYTTKTLFDEINRRRDNIRYILDESCTKDLKEEKQEGGDAEKIKSLLDALLELNYIFSPFIVKNKKLDKDAEFYNELEELSEELFDVEILDLYNQTRNYITQRPYSVEKFKLNFKNSQLLKGFSRNEEEVKCGVFLRRKDEYFLAIINTENKKLFKNKAIYSKDGEFEKMTMSYIDRKTLLGKGFGQHEMSYSNQTFDCKIKEYKNYLSENSIDIKEIDEWIDNEKNKNGKDDIKILNQIVSHLKENNCEHLLGGVKKLEDSPHTEVIDRVKEYLRKNYLEEYPELSEIIDKKFVSRKEFKSSVEETVEKLYKIRFDENERISEKKILELTTYVDNEDPKIYLFKIHNKDFSKGSKGKNKNLHTLYWNMLFDKRNLKDVVFKLDGQAEVFYREASITDEKKMVVHKNKALRKFEKDGNPVPTSRIEKINRYLNGKKVELDAEEKRLYEENCTDLKGKTIIKDKRFTEDKVFFHCPITINFKPKESQKINDMVLEYLYKREEIKIVGIDRGERNLIYVYILATKNGEIAEAKCDQASLNVIKLNDIKDGFYRRIDYHNLLSDREKDRNEARKNWQTIENIKNLKEGYLSLAVRKILDFIIENGALNGIIVMEDLNYGFKDSRARIEKQVYQKFENMLIKKLQYAVLSKKDDESDLSAPGSILNGYQLVKEDVPAYQDRIKQNGVIFYVPADYTSKIDPVTGFVNLLNTKYTNMKEAKEFFEKFDKIWFDGHYFRFEFCYKNFKNLRVDSQKLPEIKWTICSHDLSPRFMLKFNGGKPHRKEINNVNEKLKSIFSRSNINYESGHCIRDQIKNIKEEELKELLKYFSLLVSLRHTGYTDNKKNLDLIVSSVDDGNSKFFAPTIKKKQNICQRTPTQTAHTISPSKAYGCCVS